MIRINESFTAKGYTPAPTGRTIEHIDIHHWGERGQTHDGVVAFFCTTGPGSTSAHYVVSAGRIDCIVSDADVAWHSGVWSENMRSIGIECRPEATDADYAAVAELVRTLRARYGDLPLHAHREFFPTACPGVWDLDRLDRLARAGTIQTQSTPTEAKLSAAEVAEIKKHVTAQADRVIEYVGQVMVSGYKVGDKTYPGDAMVGITTQNRVNATLALVQQVLAGQTNLTPEQVAQAVKDALAQSVVSVDVNVTGK